MLEAIVGFIFVGFFMAAAFLLILGAMTLRAIVVSILWGWFMVPVFGLPPLSIPAAIGLALTYHYFVGSLSAKTDAAEPLLSAEEKKKRRDTKILGVFLNPLLALFFGWVVKTFWL